jgi:hypothetical protein
MTVEIVLELHYCCTFSQLKQSKFNLIICKVNSLEKINIFLYKRL